MDILTIGIRSSTTRTRSVLLKCRHSNLQQSRFRGFFDFPGVLSSSKPQVFSAQRRLSHPPPVLFSLITDIDSYSSFVPYCTQSSVISRTSDEQRLPTKAQLRVGWGPVEETFTSKLECANDTKAGGTNIVHANATENSIFEVLKCTWRIKEEKQTGHSGDKGSDVDLEIEYKFANPFYEKLSEAVMPKVAGKIIEAFEKRADEVKRKSSIH